MIQSDYKVCRLAVISTLSTGKELLRKTPIGRHFRSGVIVGITHSEVMHL